MEVGLVYSDYQGVIERNEITIGKIWIPQFDYNRSKGFFLKEYSIKQNLTICDNEKNFCNILLFDIENTYNQKMMSLGL